MLWKNGTAGRMDALERHFASLVMSHEKLRDELQELAKRLDGTTPAVLRADLDDLRQAVELDRLALRKQLGKIWGTIGRPAADDVAHQLPAPPSDDELSAFLALQGNHTPT